MSGKNLDPVMEFLDRWYGEAPRMLCSIVPDGALEFKCLWPQQQAESRDWLRKAVAKGCNLYYSINQPGWALDKKAEKRDIRTVRALHVDIDPDKKSEETPEQCKERALKALKAFDPPPSVLVDSGNGIQAMWLLEEPITLDGTDEGWRKAESYNLALSKAFGADHCWNIDRIFRLPGTTNIPNAKKKAKGRIERESILLESTWEKYPLSRFTPAPEIQEAGSTTARRGTVEIPGNLRRFASTDDLPVRLEEYTVMLIVNGRDVENPMKYPSRSEVLWRVMCDMVRAGADDETIASVILDPDFKISESVLEKSRPESYAAYQISKAREEAINPALRELNDRHFVVESDRSGRCVVAEEDWDDVMQRWHIKYQSFDAFRNRYMRRYVQVGVDKNGVPEMMPLGKWWLMNSAARQYRKIVFYPGREVAHDQYNLWRGFGCEPRPGDGHLGFLQHIHENICAGNAELTDYVINWMARMIQQPDTPGEVALVVRGKKGTGKGFLFRSIGSLLGQHSIQVSNTKYLVGDFNAHLRDCVFLFADEAFFAGDKRHESILKAIITEPTLTIEAKGVDAEPSPNFLHVGMASNEDWVVPASADERRYLVLDALDQRAQNTAYFRELQRQLDSGGRENLLHYLLRRDITQFEVREVPNTKALQDQKHLSQRPEHSWWYNKLREGRWLPRHESYSNEVPKDDLYQDYIDEMMRMGVGHRMSRIALGKMIHSLSPDGYPTQEQRYVTYKGVTSRGDQYERRERPWHYVFSSLDEMRKTWDRRIGVIEEWPEVNTMPADNNPLGQDDPF